MGESVSPSSLGSMLTSLTDVSLSPKKWLFLDRDGVINHDSDAYIKSLAEWQAIDGSIDAIVRLSKAGYGVIVVTNQSGLARNYFSPQTLDAIHSKMSTLVQNAGGDIQAIYFCPHGPDDGCDCRKPKDGLFLQAAADHNIDLTQCFAVGDSIRDLEAARSAGASPLLVETGKGARSLAAIAEITASGERHWLTSVPTYTNLAACVDDLLTLEATAKAQ